MNLVIAWIEAADCIPLCMALLHSVWQLAVLALIVTIIDRTFFQRSARRGFQLHVAGLVIGIVALPITLMTLHSRSDEARGHAIEATAVVQTSASNVGPFAADIVGSESATDASEREVAVGSNVAPVAALPVGVRIASVAPWVAALYLVGVVMMLLRLANGIRHAHRLRRSAEVITDGPLQRSLQSLVDRWGMRMAPMLAYSSAVDVPQVIGLTKCTILLPASAMTGLSTSDMEMILAHELAHVRRHDIWIQLLQRIAETVLFFNPALWYLSHRISVLREYCCDDMTCRLVSDRESRLPPEARYANALVQVALQSQRVAGAEGNNQSERQLATLAAVSRSPSELRRRVARLMGIPLREPLQVSRGSVVFFAIALALLWTGTNVWSQRADDESKAQAGDDVAEVIDPDHPVVTGQILLPNGQPAADVVIMTATDKFGWGEGFTNGNYTITDANGRYRIVSKRRFPQRIFWLPAEYENNSRAVENKGGEQKPIKLKAARKIRGSVNDFDGNAIANLWVRADGASRTPITWAQANEQGEFQFRPLPPGEYSLQPVRSYHEQLTGQLKFYSMKHAFNAVKFDLKAAGDSAPAYIIAPETVTIRVKVVDAEGQGVPREHVSIGDIGDFSNAMIADPVADQSGVYEFRFPKGKYIRDLKLRHSRDQIAYYQETPQADPLPAEALVLSEAKQDIDGITITVRPSANLLVQLKDADGNVFDSKKTRVSVTVEHPTNLSPPNRSTIAHRPAHFLPAKSKGLHEFKGVIPNCDVTVGLSSDDYQAIAQRVRLTEGETRTIDLVVKEKTTAMLRGKIVAENGNEVTKKGWLYSRGTYQHDDPNVTNSYSSTEAHVARQYAVEVPRGKVLLSLYTPGFAPAWLGPIEVGAKEEREDFDFTLKRGFSFPIQVSDPDGTPIAGATILAHPEIDGVVEGPNFDRMTDDKGHYLCEHAAKTRYAFRVTATGFESLSVKPIEIAADQLLTLTLKPSPMTRGVVRDSAGSPVDNAKIFRVAMDSKSGGRMLSGSAFGDQIGKTDERGHFELDSLSSDASYLMLVQADNNARMLGYNFVAGKQDIELVMPKRLDLRIKIVGDTHLLLHRHDKPYVSVRQHVPIQVDNPRSRTVVGTEAFVTKTQDGGIALYQGLVPGTVRVGAGKQSKTVDVNEEGVTEVEFVLDASNDQAEVVDDQQ